ncbi:MAG: flagellar type III secretion system protein FliQ [Clostridiales bacterium]|nr:flagellar type III secretion system protein FliQ [Clostridiales bacterium]
MDAGLLAEIFRDAVITGFKVAGPILISSILIGLIISIIQAATSINEQTMTFVPKLIVIGITLIIFGSWMLQQLVDLVFRITEFITVQL